MHMSPPCIRTGGLKNYANHWNKSTKDRRGVGVWAILTNLGWKTLWNCDRIPKGYSIWKGSGGVSLVHLAAIFFTFHRVPHNGIGKNLRPLRGNFGRATRSTPTPPLPYPAVISEPFPHHPAAFFSALQTPPTTVSNRRALNHVHVAVCCYIYTHVHVNVQ